MTPINLTYSKSKLPFYLIAERIVTWAPFGESGSRIIIEDRHEAYVKESPEEILAAIQFAKGGQP